MNDLLTDPKSWVIGILGILGTIVTWLFKRELSRIDKAMEESVRRDELTQLRADIDRRHQESAHRQDKRHEENTDRLDRIETGVTGTHQRIDQLYRDLPKMLREP
jgi:uncharacterized membrane-anchored protein YjiN (DUF445 family)